jgi:hypothetical protein
LGEVADRTRLTRKTAARILEAVKPAVFGQFRLNPEGFLAEASRLINEVKGSVVVFGLAIGPAGSPAPEPVGDLKRAKAESPTPEPVGGLKGDQAESPDPEPVGGLKGAQAESPAPEPVGGLQGAQAESPANGQVRVNLFALGPRFKEYFVRAESLKSLALSAPTPLDRGLGEPDKAKGAIPPAMVCGALPKGFLIATPLGDYRPEWALAFNEGEARWAFFVAEGPGSLKSLKFSPMDGERPEFEERFFAALSGVYLDKAAFCGSWADFGELLALVGEVEEPISLD